VSDELHDAELRAALNRLGRRGSPRGFDAVLAGAAAAAERDAIAAERVERDGDGFDDLEPIPFVTTEPVRGRRPLGSMIAAAGIASLLVVGTLAVSAVFGNSGSGSSSPEGAVRRLADALSHEDPLAAADVLAPQEVRSLHGTVQSAERRAAELQLVHTAGAPLAGVDLNVDGLKLTTESLADGFTKVVVDAGTVSASTHKAQFSALLQKALHASGDNSTHADLAALAADIKLPTFVVAVRDSGKWYVSAAYTGLEYLREYNQLPAADFGAGQRAVSTLGAATPDAAVQDAMHALQQADWTRLMALAPPDELPVYDYRAAITALIDRDTADSAGGKPSFTIDSMTTKAQVDGDTARVTLNASGTTDSGKWSINGGCFSAPPSETSVVGTSSLCLGADAYILGPYALLYGGLDASAQISVVQRGGRWFVSPVGTVLDTVNREIATLDQRMLYALLNIPEELPPDGAVTLGKPIAVPASMRGPAVYSLAGKAGEQLLGLVTPNEATYDSSLVDAQVFAPDGSLLYQADGMFSGHAFTVPADGTYKLVVRRFLFSSGKDATVTLWDAADAPAAAKDTHGEQCTYTQNSSSCSSSGSRSSGSTSGQLGVPATVPAIVSPPGPTPTCTATANIQGCSSTATTFVPATVGGGGNPGTTVAIGNGVSVSGPGTTAPGG
jgi:hypothetical protein